MNLNKFCFFLLCTGLSIDSYADAKRYPSAYAGLEPDAYLNIALSTDKSQGWSFQLDNKHISWSANTDKTSSSNHDFSFTKNLPNGYISATQGNDSLFGSMHLDNKHYVLTTDPTGIWAVQLPQKALMFNDCGFDHAAASPKQQLNTQLLQQHQADKAAGTIIDLLVVHDQNIANRYPGDLLTTRVNQYVHVSNQTYANSALDMAIRLVGIEQVPYDIDNTNQEARDHMQLSLDNTPGTIQGFETLKTLRENTGADLVIFLRIHDIETRGNCGIAFFPTTGGQSTFDSSYGVNVMADGMSSWSICTDQLMVHEIGHNLGAGHHNVAVENRFIPDAAGFAKLGQYGTAMGSFGTGQPDRFFEMNYFSNPNVQCGGAPCGVTGVANNANVINQTKDLIAAYMNAVSAVAMPDDLSEAMIDQDQDGVLDRDDAFPFNAAETIDSDGDGVGDNQDVFPNTASEQSDFDLDGIGDLADFDDDDDGILDMDDDFPFNAAEVKDSDRDGVGDMADDFVFEQGESLDSDDDGIGNNSDNDDDNDGVIDIDSTKQDLLVISVGNNRILRFDAQTGQSKGIEVLPSDGLLTFQSDLTHDPHRQILYYTSASTIKKYDLMNRETPVVDLIPPYSNTAVQIGSGFPTALLQSDDTNLLVATLRTGGVRNFDYRNASQPFLNSFSPIVLPDGSANDFTETLIDFVDHPSGTFALGRNQSVYKLFGDDTFRIVGPEFKNWLRDPYAFVVTDDNQLIHTDQRLNTLVMTDAITGNFAGVFANLTDLGYSNPTGIEISNDGRLLVAASDQDVVLQFDLSSQQFMGELASGFGLDQPHKMLLVPQLNDRFHQDSGKVIRPNAGSWYNPDKSGRGLDVGIFNNRLQVIWFVYENDGTPIWYYSAGDLVGHEYQALLYRTKQISDTEISFTEVGSFDITFTNERTATFNWQIGDESDTEQIQWLQYSFEPENDNFTGMWSRPDSPGWGVAVTTIGPSTVLLPFIYDAQGDPRWVITGPASGQQMPLSFDVGTFFSETLCPGCAGEPNSQTTLSGTMMMDFGVNPYWQSDVAWPDPISGSWVLDDVEIRRISSPPVRPR